MKKMPFMLYAPLMDSLLEFANSDTARADANTPAVANNSVMYEVQGSVAIISIDGGMYKKDMGGMCMSVASYDTMVKFIDKAESDDSVKTILYRVDTGGGSVAGADEVEDRIFKSKKRTVTLYENIGASGGLWIFTASDEVYATETTMLGSIGVVVSYLEKDEKTGEKRVEIVSKNAQNKRCSLNGTCKEEIQGMIDTYEEMFYARIEKNTGFGADMIQTTFNNGGVIFAKEAHKAGFIQGITTFDDLLASIKVGTNPLEASATVQIDKNSTKESNLDYKAKFEESDEKLTASIAENATLTASLEKANATIATLEAKAVEGVESAEAKAVEVAEAKAVTTSNIVAMAFEKGASKDTALEMLKKDTIESAGMILLEANGSNGSSTQVSTGDGEPTNSDAILAYAEKIKGSKS
jgi:ClpP class serine protease